MTKETRIYNGEKKASSINRVVNNGELHAKLSSQVAQRLKAMPAMWETWVQSLGQQDPLEKEMATHSSSLTWRIPCTEEPGGLPPVGCKESDMTEQLTLALLKMIKYIWKKGV